MTYPYVAIPQGLLILLFIFLSGCASNGDKQGGPEMKSLSGQTAKATSTGDLSLTDTRWILSEVNGTPAPPGNNDRQADMILTHDGQVKGFAGCNRFMGPYLLESGQFHIGPLASTRMACPQGMDLENQFLQALQKTARFGIRNGILSLYDARGRTILRFRANTQD